MPRPVTDSYFYFSKKERNGILVILLILVLSTAGPFIYRSLFKKPAPQHDYTAQIAALEALKPDSSSPYDSYASDRKPYQQYNQKYSGQTYSDFENKDASLFYFDPNSISVEDWKRLGVKEKTANSIQKYISKGGKFRQPDDIKKIWGISPEKMEQLLPYVRIAPLPQRENNNYQPYAKTEYVPYEKKKTVAIDINAADTLGYASLPGIGPGYARRITKFRDRLGGFHSVEQVAETFGLPDSAFQKIKPFLQLAAGNIHKLNINSATEEELKAHPYIRWQYAKLIVAYRSQHGNYNEVTDLQKIMALPPEDFNKIKYYVSVQ